MNLVFENVSERSNFSKCADMNQSGILRFTPSAMVNTLYEKLKPTSIFNSIDLKDFIIATGVNHSPEQWVRGFDRSIFENLNPHYLEALQNHKAILVLDQSLEGYQTDWLWNDLHKDCNTHLINPRAVVYITGNALAPSQYKLWCEQNNIDNCMTVIAYEHFEIDIQKTLKLKPVSYTWAVQIAYKKANPIKTYNCLNRRLRSHRIWFYTELYRHNLLDSGLVSMNRFDHVTLTVDNTSIDMSLLNESKSILPLEIYGQSNIEKDDYFYIRRIMEKVYLDSYVSVVTEPQFAEKDLSVFCSEKIFKSIACLHPFIIVGGKGSLARLKALGYKTFDKFFDESYDTLDSAERIQAIIKVLKYIDSIEDKLSWFESMKEVIEHNRNVLMNRKMPQAGIDLAMYYYEYFNV